MQFLAQDLRYGLRSLVRNPGFSVVAILALALGIGPNSAIFTIVNAVLMKPLPMPEPNRVVMIWQTLLKSGFDQMPVSANDYLDWKRQAHSFEEMAAAFASSVLNAIRGSSLEDILEHATAAALALPPSLSCIDPRWSEAPPTDPERIRLHRRLAEAQEQELVAGGEVAVLVEDAVTRRTVRHAALRSRDDCRHGGDAEQSPNRILAAHCRNSPEEVLLARLAATTASGSGAQG